jgi:ribosome recycling factor
MNDLADTLLFETEARMEKAIHALLSDLTQIRTGRANPGLLDHIMISYYGVDTQVNQVASISVVEGTQLLIKPYDKSLLKAIEQAIQASQLGLNPLNDGTSIRLILPQPTQERRKALVKDVEKHGEASKIAIRNIRRDTNDQLKKIGLPEDDEKGYQDDCQQLTDTFIKKIDEEVKIKSQELLKI